MKFVVVALLALISPRAHAFEDLFRPAPRGFTFEAQASMAEALATQGFTAKTRVTPPDGDTSTLKVSTERTAIGNAGIRPDTTFWNPSVSYFQAHEFNPRHRLGGGISVGSPSDQPYRSFDEVDLGAQIFYQIPHGTVSSWIFALPLNSRRLRFFPAAAYFWSKPDRSFTLLAGVPFLVAWEFVEGVTFRTGLLAPPIGGADFMFMPWKPFPFRVTAGFQWATSVFYPSDRLNKDESFYLENKRARIEIASPLTKSIAATLEFGALFGRRSYEAEDFFSEKSGRADMPASAYGLLRVSQTF